MQRIATLYDQYLQRDEQGQLRLKRELKDDDEDEEVNQKVFSLSLSKSLDEILDNLLLTDVSVYLMHEAVC